jgi:hypothetical protein
MRKMSKSFFLAILLPLFYLSPVHAQLLSSPPADANSKAAPPAPANPVQKAQAPDDMTKKITDLVHAGKYTEAQQLTTGLLVTYPNDQRLIKAKALIEKLLVPAGSGTATQSDNQPAVREMTANAAPLTGMDKVEYNSLIELARQAQQQADPEQQKGLLKRLLSRSYALLQKYPDQMFIWQLRATAALGLDDPYAPYVGYEAGQQLMTAGAASSNDPNVQQLMSKLNLKGWLDAEQMEEAKKNTADSLTNGLGMRFARVTGTTAVFSILLTRVKDFRAFVDDTHYDATQGMQAAVFGHQGACFLCSYVGPHYESLGGSWEDPAYGVQQTPDNAVEGISWEDAEAFCRWLTETERRVGKIRSDQRYRLPTDSEWSLAVGLSGEKGDTPESKSGKIKTRIPNYGNNNVGIPNVYGLYGLGGVLSQYCEDWLNAKRVGKVSRGGSWFLEDQRASDRREIAPTVRANDFGFRVVLANDTDN